MSDDQKLYSTKQAAKFLGVDRKTIQRWRKAGILTPDSFGKERKVLYTERQLIQVGTFHFSSKRARGDIQDKNVPTQSTGGDIFQPQVGTFYTQYTEEQLKLVSFGGKIGINSETGVVERVQCSEIGIKKGATFEIKGCKTHSERVTNPENGDKPGNETAQNGQLKNVTRQMVPQTIVTRLLNSGSTTEVDMADEENSPSVEVEEFYFDDNDDDIIIINDSFKTTLPEEHRQNLTKLFGKLTVAPFGEIFATPFNREETLITYAKLDYANSGITFNGKFDDTHELILNSLYSFYRAENILFTSRNILQHIFGNVPDHFQSELVEVIEQHLDELRCMRISMDLKDKFGNNAFIKLHGEKYRPIALDEDILDVSILEMKSAKNSKVIKVYRINRLSSIFKYAEKLKQITSWRTELMKVPVRKTIQNALLCNYLLVKISLVKNSKNKYKNNGILFTTIHEDLNLDVDNRNKVKNIRDNIRKMFDYWLKIGLIKSYQFERRGTSFYKISFTVA